jgi:hypothetical protein
VRYNRMAIILLFIASLSHAQDATPSEREDDSTAGSAGGGTSENEDPCDKRARIRQHIIHLGTLRNSFTASTSLV